MSKPFNASPLMVRASELSTVIPISDSQRAEFVKRGEFCKPVALSDSGRAQAYLMDELIAWRDWRREKRDGLTTLSWDRWFAKWRERHQQPSQAQPEADQPEQRVERVRRQTAAE